MGGAFEFTRLAAANLREKDDSWNPAIGGFFGGAVAGMKCERFANCKDRPLRMLQSERSLLFWASALVWQ